jgi:HAE1 family hydrophobic/amphiphilic exporter-1
MTVSLAAVFIPLVFMPGLVGRIFREFAVTIVVSIFASGLVSLTLTPLMCARMLGERGHGAKQTLMERLTGGVIDRIVKLYGRTLRFFLRWKSISAIAWIGSFVGTILLFQAIPKSFLPVGDSSFLFGFCIAQEGASPRQMREYQDRIDQAMRSNEDVEMTFTASGISGFFPSNFAVALAFLKPPQERAPIGAVGMDLMGRIGQAQEGVLAFMQPQPVLEISTGATGRSTGQFSYAISGTDPDEVYSCSEQLVAKLRADGRFMSVQPDYYHNTPNLDIEILRDQAAMYGVSVNQIETLLKKAYSQNFLYLIKQPNDQYQVILEAQDSNRGRPQDLELLYVRSDDGKNLVPLKAVARWHETLGPQSVNHLNQFTAVTIAFNLRPGVAIGEASEFVKSSASQILPATLRGDFMGEAKTFEETSQSLVWLVLLAVFVMYVILGILYESYIHPITVLSSLPVALVGGLATLMLFHSELSLYAAIGMFMLMGIVKKNGIMVIDFALQKMATGATSEEAIYEACLERFRPIIMTTLAALMGAIPIALGFGADGASRRPLGLVIVGGLVVSQLITLYVTPVLYLYLEWFQENVLDRMAFFRTGTRPGVKAPAEG